MHTDREGVLVTGATGLIGYHVARTLSRDEGLHTVCIVRPGSNPRKLAALRDCGVSLEEGSFLDLPTLNRIFDSHSIRYVVHLAALRGGGAGSQDEYARVNVQGTEGLLQLSLERGVRRFVFCSSVGVFGTIPLHSPAGEATPLNGDNLYHASKIEAERRAADYVAKGLDVRVVRPTITYGLEDSGFPTTLVNLARSRRFVVCGRDVLIHLLDADKMAEFVHLILRREQLKGSVFIVADSGPISLGSLVNMVHLHHYGVPYPRLLRMPKPVFSAAAIFFQLIRNEKWLARILLTSRDWHYDLRSTMSAVPEWVPARTEDSFLSVMCKTG